MILLADGGAVSDIQWLLEKLQALAEQGGAYR